MKITTVASLAVATVIVCGVAAPAGAQGGKNPPGVNPTHYECYRLVEAQTQAEKVKLKDQFGVSEAALLRPIFLCAPTDKNNLPAKDKTTHYLCYEQEGGKSVDKRAQITNQFGSNVISIGLPFMLCVPSLKK